VLSSLHEEAVAARALAEAFRPRAAELVEARARQARLEEQLDSLDASLAAVDTALAEHPAELASARAEVDQAQRAAAEQPALEQEVSRLEEQLVASTRLETVTAELVAATTDLAAAKAAALAAYDAYLTVREARIEGMAAELAGKLAVGCACPVCGSSSHPEPAHVSGAVVGRAEEDVARKVHEDSAFVQQGHEVRVATLLAERASLDDRLAGVERATLRDELSASRSRLTQVRELAADGDARVARLRAVQARGEAARTARDRVLVDRATTRQQLEAAAAAVGEISTDLAAILGDEAPDLDALIAQRVARCEALAVALAAWAAHDEASRAVVEADGAAERASVEAGFADRAEAASALVSPEEAQSIESTLTRAQATRLAAEQVLADPATRAAVAEPAPDLPGLVAAHGMAVERAQAATSAHDAAEARCRRLGILERRLADRLAAWTPLREQHALVAQLSQLVEGKGPDNPLRIRLAAYVLSERLRQVVASANERLARMTGQRYSLEHTDDRGAGEQRGGLSLRVHDDWNGVSRDPATLSGGETFVVSLALALGLADTVAHEAGGTDIDTLFIDEGFGSLDTDTLEDVMDTLDSLRDGGRVVGLVSHVPELRSRITTQLEVLKERTGSTVRQVLTAG
jgi:exonuclease SbcC